MSKHMDEAVKLSERYNIPLAYVISDMKKAQRYAEEEAEFFAKWEADERARMDADPTYWDRHPDNPEVRQ